MKYGSSYKCDDDQDIYNDSHICQGYFVHPRDHVNNKSEHQAESYNPQDQHSNEETEHQHFQIS